MKDQGGNYMGKRLTHEEFSDRIRTIFGAEIKCIGAYINQNTKIIFQHELCGVKFEMRPDRLKDKTVDFCPVCHKNNRTPYNFRQWFEYTRGNEYLLLSKYKGGRKSVIIKHRPCGSTISITPEALKAGHGECPTCRVQDYSGITKTHEAFVSELEDLYGKAYLTLDYYQGAYKKLTLKHLTCGYEFKAIPHNLLRGHGCPRCGITLRANKQRKSQLQFESEVKDMYGDDYTVVGEYKSDGQKIEMRHNYCKNTWMVTPNNILRGRECPYCANSLGENYIERFLNQAEIQHVRQKRFSDCADKYPLPFDFYLPSYNLLIEYDGEQHYKPIRHFGGEKAFQIRHKHDLIKNNYCEDNGINLLRIPYTIKGGAIGETIQAKLDELTKLDSIA